MLNYLDVQQIDKRINCAVLNKKRHLDYLVRAAEHYKDKEVEKRIIFLKNEINKMVQEGDTGSTEYHAKRVEKEYYEKYIRISSFLIELKEEEDMAKGIGQLEMQSKGATIYYSAHSNHLEKHVIIAHEVGHILLHTPDWLKNNFEHKINPHPIIEPHQENEATYFAEEILNILSCKMQDDENLKDLTVADNDLHKVIKKIQSAYTPENISGYTNKYPIDRFNCCEDT